MKYDSYFDFDETRLAVTSYEVLGRLPDLFLKDDGTRVKDAAEWPARRAELYKTAVELQYGTQPPAPEVFQVECTYKSAVAANYRITAGTRARQTSFMLRILLPKGAEHPPVVVDGDLCFPYPFNSEYTSEFLNRGIAYACFNRTELANDIQGEGRGHGPLYEIYPEYSFGALGAWAWGYLRVTDALDRIGEYDLSALAYTGHSRGAKTAMLAGVLDERARIVNPNETNAGSCSCYRIHMKGLNMQGEEAPSETLRDLWSRFDFWLGEGMGAYIDREEELPFDAHFLKAMVAPRTLLIGEACGDLWTNPVGSWQTTMAAGEAFKLLGCPENLYWYFREGTHYHHPADGEMLASLIDYKLHGTPLPEGRFFRTPFEKPEPIW